MNLSLTGKLAKSINLICDNCKHLRVKIATEEHLDPIVYVCGLTNEETTEGSTCSKWEMEED